MYQTARNILTGVTVLALIAILIGAVAATFGLFSGPDWSLVYAGAAGLVGGVAVVLGVMVVDAVFDLAEHAGAIRSEIETASKARAAALSGRPDRETTP